MKIQNKKRKAIYAGSFDPLHHGHLWMIREGSRMFDELVVAVGKNPAKKSAFSLEERVEMIKQVTKNLANVRVASFENDYCVNYAESVGADYILKGLRNEQDYWNERKQRNINGEINPAITTIFLMTPREYEEVSSSMIKSMVGFNGWKEVVKKYLPEAVYNKFVDKYK